MVLRVDVRQVPPVVELVEQDDFGSFKTVVVVGSHTWVSPATLHELGPEADGRWWQDLEGMIVFAREHGWTDDQGRIRAHVDLAGDAPD